MIPFLKVAVVLMGILIVAGIVGLGMMMYGKLTDVTEGEGPKTEVEATTVVTPAPVDISASMAAGTGLGLPEGSRVKSLIAEGHRMVMVVQVPGEGERVVVVDLRNSQITGNIVLQRAR
ncbi:MAG: hypothetical protein HOK61_10965 [Alphaproteobacteria bacterium]|jgi:hypothetical protein|nr:hypothetical protein [Alphaproteobacteria bacterium]